MIQEAYPIWPEIKAKIRSATEEDIPVLLDLAQKGIDQCGIPETPIDREWLTKAWKAVIANPQTTWNSVVEADGKIVGYSHGYLGGQWHISKPMAYLCTLYIQPTHRSIKVFDWLIEGFLNWARTVGAEAVWSCLTNSLRGPVLDRLWRRRGFHPAGQMYERYL